MSYNRNEKHKRHRNRENDNRQRRREEPRINTIGKNPSHVTVIPKWGEHPERTIKRFLKKCKKIKIIEEYRKREFFEKPSAKRRRARLRREAPIKKEALKKKD